MAGTPLAAIGVKIGYLAGAITDTTPTTGFTHIRDLKSTGELNPAPNTADATTFDNKEYTTFVELLKDLGGAIDFGANLTDVFLSDWDACCTAVSTNGGCWFIIAVEGLSTSKNAVVFYGKPSKVGMPGMTANSLIETTVRIVPMKEPEWKGVTISTAITDPSSGSGSPT